MRIQTVRLHNFKKFDEAVFQFHPKFNVLIGDNAAGKTSVLDALAILLGGYLLRSGIVSGRSGIKKGEKRLIHTEKEGQVFLEPQDNVFVEANGVFQGRSLKWRRHVGDRGSAAKELIAKRVADCGQILEGRDVGLPVLTYYGTGRLWNTHRDVKVGKPESRLAAYQNCLDPKSDESSFKKWFKRLELSSLQSGKTLPALEAIRSAVMTCIPEAERFYFDVAEDQLIIGFRNIGQMPFDNLSDGYRNMVAMVADIAYRASHLNPHKGIQSVKTSSGVVLVDEIDLHLHPRWQRHVVRDLQNAFPALQFIATTHSAFILQSLDPGQVIDLNRPTLKQSPQGVGLEIGAPGPDVSFSNRSIEDIIEDVMGVAVPQRSHRHQEMYETAKEYYRIVEDGREADETRKEALKQKLDALSAPFSDDVAYHAFLEMQRMAAGINPSEKGKIG